MEDSTNGDVYIVPAAAIARPDGRVKEQVMLREIERFRGLWDVLSPAHSEPVGDQLELPLCSHSAADIRSRP